MGWVETDGGRPVTIFLGGDVMTGRGVDQILPHPGDPRLWEPQARDASAYVQLAEDRNGPVPRPVAPSWPWGDALTLLDELAPDVRIVNLETSITTRGEPEPGKAVHYRMSPANLPCLTAGGVHACALANNHAGDFGPEGLRDTRQELVSAAVAVAGAGRDLDEARQPARVPVGGDRAVLLFSVATTSSGVPPHWAAAPGRPGVDLLADLSDRTADALAARVGAATWPGDLAVVSIHWGSNWGYDVPQEHVRFARRLIDGGVDLVHGHSSHHPRPLEAHRGRLILYGCGDLIDDYEGIAGHQRYRPDLRLLYLASVQPGSGRLTSLRMAPMQVRRMRLHHASPEDAARLASVLTQVGEPYGAVVDPGTDGLLHLRGLSGCEPAAPG